MSYFFLVSNVLEICNQNQASEGRVVSARRARGCWTPTPPSFSLHRDRWFVLNQANFSTICAWLENQFFWFVTIGSIDSYTLVEVAESVYASHYDMRVKLAKKIDSKTWAFNVPGRFASHIVGDFLCQVIGFGTRTQHAHLTSLCYRWDRKRWNAMVASPGPSPRMIWTS